MFSAGRLRFIMNDAGTGKVQKIKVNLLVLILNIIKSGAGEGMVA